MERRRQERYALDVPIKIRLSEDGPDSTLEASSKDISSSGVFIKTCSLPLQPRQKVHLELTLTIEKLKELFSYSDVVTLEVDGSVVGTRDNGIVVAFDQTYTIKQKAGRDGQQPDAAAL
jgi:hypothetical protein